MKKTKWSEFLKDVFICSLGAYGGPESHFGVFTDQLVIKKQYLTEEELLELIALTGVLPGPSSTQSIVAIGYKVGGPILGALTMLVWALPVLTLMTLLSFLSAFLINANISTDSLRYLEPMAIGFVGIAACRISRKVVNNTLSVILLVFSSILTYFIRTPWIYPLALLIGALVTLYLSNEPNKWNRVKIVPKWRYLILFVILALVALGFHYTLKSNILANLFESFYRFGYLVVGGGQVVVPMMHNEVVEINHYLTSQEFLVGFGLVQGFPGPMFSFSAYVGGLATRNFGPLLQILGGYLAGLSIFLPGLLLIYFVYPIWEQLKKITGIQISIKGVTAIAAGFIVSAFFVLLKADGPEIDKIVITLITIGLLHTKKVAAPMIVLMMLLLGFII